MSLLSRQQLMMAQGLGGGDPFWASVFSLCPMAGTSGSTSFPDLISGRAWTPTSASISTSQSPFTGGSSGSFGTSGYLTTNTLADWAFLHNSSTSYTIDVYVYVNALGANRSLFGNNAGSSAHTGLGCWIDSTGHLRFFMTGTGVTVINWVSTGVLFAAAGWYLVSLEWNPAATGTLWAYVNGTLVNSGSGGTGSSGVGSLPTYALNLGALGNGSLPVDGFEAQWRVTKALRYGGASFAPPTGPWPTH